MKNYLNMINIKRKTKYENRYHRNMGLLRCRVIRIYLCILGLPMKTLHEYRKTYYGEVKDTKDCILSK